jgi:ribosome-associated toxin RatA of RatAB toxin-antitoxin module
MAHAEYREKWFVNKEKLFSVITDYSSYPDFVDGCHAAEMVKNDPGKTRVKYHVNVMSKDMTYVLDHEENLETGKVEWKLVESNFFKVNNGRWELKTISEHETEVTYILDIEFKFPVPGFILDRLVKGGLPRMVTSFERRVRESSA